MPTGQPDPRFLDASESEAEPEYVASVDVVRGHAERLIRKAMEAGEFDDLPGTGKPIPGAGTVDDELWWVRSWLKRNQDHRSEDYGW